MSHFPLLCLNGILFLMVPYFPRCPIFWCPFFLGALISWCPIFLLPYFLGALFSRVSFFLVRYFLEPYFLVPYIPTTEKQVYIWWPSSILARDYFSGLPVPAVENVVMISASPIGCFGLTFMLNLAKKRTSRVKSRVLVLAIGWYCPGIF